MKPLTPEQQAFAEEHHGLLLDFMAKHSLGDDYYDLLANRYLKVVVRYLSMMASGAWSKITSPISSLRRSSSATRATPIVKLLNYAESVAKRLKSALPGSAKYYLIIRRIEL